ncbi:unnamed protein product, partial [Closterium sp. NIES-54]
MYRITLMYFYSWGCSAGVSWLPHIHPPQQQLQQWETEEEEEQGTPLTRHPPTRHPQTLKE